MGRYGQKIYSIKTLDYTEEIFHARDIQRYVKGGGIYASPGSDHYPDLP